MMPSGGAYPAKGERRERFEGRWDNGLGRKEQRESVIRDRQRRLVMEDDRVSVWSRKEERADG